MSLDYIASGDYGQPIRLTILDADTDAAADLSAYTGTVSVILRNPAGTETTKTAAFATDGSDGIVEYTLAEGDINALGRWAIRAQVTIAETALMKSEWEEFTVI